MTQLLYGAGLRLSECVRLRVKDIDLGQRAILVRNAKGSRDRTTMLPEILAHPLRRELSRTKRIHEQDLKKGHGAVYLPHALVRITIRDPDLQLNLAGETVGFRNLDRKRPFLAKVEMDLDDQTVPIVGIEVKRKDGVG